MDAADVDTEPGVRQPRVRQPCWIRKVEVDNQHGERRENDVEAQLTEAGVCVPGVYLAVAVTIPEQDVLLQHRLPAVSRPSVTVYPWKHSDESA